MSFNDHFSGHADVYASARPTYPPQLFHYLSGLCSRKELAWDCAAGNGQAAHGLLPYYDKVIMSDASSEQISQASEITENDTLFSGVMLAEQLALKDNVVDIAVVAQALHWFNLGQFFTELNRVLRSGGIFAAWSYGQHSIDAECDAIVYTLYEEILGDYWPPERKLVEAGYEGIEFPFDPIESPGFKLEKQWSIEQVLGYLNSWSAVQRYKRDKGEDPVLLIKQDLQSAYGSKEERTICWPLTLIVRRKTG